MSEFAPYVVSEWLEHGMTVKPRPSTRQHRAEKRGKSWRVMLTGSALALGICGAADVVLPSGPEGTGYAAPFSNAKKSAPASRMAAEVPADYWRRMASTLSSAPVVPDQSTFRDPEPAA